MINEAVMDLRMTVRNVLRERAFFSLAVITLAVGIAAAVTAFGMVNQIVLRPVPGVPDPDRVAYLEFRTGVGEGSVGGRGINHPDFEALRRGATLLGGMASQGFSSYGVSVDGSQTREVMAANVVGDFFELLGVRPAAGRLLRVDETGPTSDPRVVVISELLSRQLFGTPEGAVGQTVRLDGESATVVGVAGGGFRGPERRIWVDLWLPYSGLVVFNDFSPETLVERRSTNHGYLLASLRHGVSLAAAENQLASILQEVAAGQAEESPRVGRLRPHLIPGLTIPPGERGQAYATLALFGGAAVLVLLIACANVALLLLARNVSRRPIIATRRVLGASPARIAGQHLMESLLLGAFATACGLLLAWWVQRLFRGERLPFMPAFDGLFWDLRVLAFAASAAVLTALLFGTIPALLAGRFDLAAALRGVMGRDPRAMSVFRKAVSASQVALCVPLLVGASLLTRTVANLYGVDTGVMVDHTWRFGLGPVENPADRMRVDERYTQLAESVSQIPGVHAAAVAWLSPFTGKVGNARIGLPSGGSAVLNAGIRPVTSGWFRALGVAFEAGGSPAAENWSPTHPIPVIITASLSRRLFGEEEPLGRAVRVGRVDLEDGIIAGVTSDLRISGEIARPSDAFFVPLGTVPIPQASLLVRAPALGRDVATSIQRTAGTALGTEVLAPPEALSARLDALFSEQRLLRQILGMTGGLALLLAMVGLYGVMSFSVAGRMAEFGVRRALGAQASDIAARVFAHGGYIVLTGSAVGLLGALLISAVLESRLFGVSALDPLSYGVALAAFFLAGGAACWRPARTAASANPIDVMRRS